MKVTNRLIIGFSFIICVAILIGAVGLIGMLTLRQAGLNMYERQVLSLEYVGKSTIAFKQMRIDCRQVVISSFYDDRQGASNAKEAFFKHQAEFENWMDKLSQIESGKEFDDFRKRLLKLYGDQFLPKTIDIIDYSIADMPNHYNKLRINVLMASTYSVSSRMDNLFIGMMDLETALAKQTSEKNEETMRRMIVALCALIIFTGLVAVIVAYYITRSITKPINESSEVLKEIAKGNFSARVVGDYKGDFELVKHSVNETAIQLSSYLTEKIDAQNQAHESELAMARAEASAKAVYQSLEYASKIQRNLLPNSNLFEKAFMDFSVIWKPKDVVGGDIYWSKTFDEGTVLCVCDCTGHGTPGALLTMLVVSALESAVDASNYKDTANTVWVVEQKLKYMLYDGERTGALKRYYIKDGCDIAILYIAADGSVTISSGNISVFVCNGEDVERIKGQRVFVGHGSIKNKEEILTNYVAADPRNKFYIASDGLYDQIGGANRVPFGYKTFKSILLESHEEDQLTITNKIWDAFENHRGSNAQRDDVQLLTFKPYTYLEDGKI